MKVLVYFRSSILARRGTPLRCRNLVVWLSRRPGVQVTLLSRDESSSVQRFLTVDHLAIRPSERALPRLQRALGEIRPDVVYGQTHKGAGDLARLAGGVAPPLVADLHGDLAFEKLENRQWPWRRRIKGYLSARVVERRSLARLDGFTVVSDALRRRLAPLGKPVKLLAGGVDTKLFCAPQMTPRDQITVGYAGSYRSYHGVDDLLAAAAILVRRQEPFRFLMVGDLDQAPGLRKRLVRELGERVTLIGSVAQHRLPEILSRCDVLVVPRRRGRAAEYNYPSKLSEFLALGRAVVVTDVGEAGRLVRSGETAVKVPPADPETLAEALRDLEDPLLRRRLGEASRSFAIEHLDWRRIASELEGFLRHFVVNLD